MKKILSLWTLCLLGVKPMVAGIYYQPAGQSANRDYPSQEFKDNTPFLLGNPREDFYNKVSYGGRTYLSPTGMRGAATESCVYTFVPTGKKNSPTPPRPRIRMV